MLGSVTQRIFSNSEERFFRRPKRFFWKKKVERKINHAAVKIVNGL